MLDRLFRKAAKAQSPGSGAAASEKNTGKLDPNAVGEDAMDETGTFMLDVSQLQDSEELEDLLKDL
jgi:hypothetical protein